MGLRFFSFESDRQSFSLVYEKGFWYSTLLLQADIPSLLFVQGRFLFVMGV